jgi:hypothetical protein
MILRLDSKDYEDREIKKEEREREWKRVRRVDMFSLAVTLTVSILSWKVRSSCGVKERVIIRCI